MRLLPSSLLGKLLFALATIVTLSILAGSGIPVVHGLATFLLVAGVIYLALWATFRLVRALLWRVGRRLALSYFLIGVLPIPMVLLLAGLGLYLLAGFFLSHVYRDAVRGLESDLAEAAEIAVRTSDKRPTAALAESGGQAFALYRNGKRIAGDERAPMAWPDWIPHLADPNPAESAAGTVLPMAALADGTVSVVGGARSGELAVLAFTTAPLSPELTRRSGIWVEMSSAGDDQERNVKIQVLGKSLELTTGADSRDPEGRQRFFAKTATSGGGYVDRPLLFWVEQHKPLRQLADGGVATAELAATLNASAHLVSQRVFSPSAEVDSTAWAALFGISVLLFEVYLAAVAMAVFMIFSLSRAVNRLSRATAAVQGGDFSVRIPVKRKDQLGELQRSFNRMAENLESLVATSAQKEVLEKELSLARELQRSLLPPEHLGDSPTQPIGLPRPGRGTAGHDAIRLGISEATARDVQAHLVPGPVTFATHFAPSAAIGGDYFDILRLDRERVAVAIADVSGHGLSAGLRMAMLKAALVILIEDGNEPQVIFERLDGVVRRGGDSRAFVTATLGILDTRTGRLDLINAGHPPTYVIHAGEVREIMLPSSPLGAMGHRYGHSTLQLQPNDVVLWLSDGLVEATNLRQEPFGYERVVLTLSGAPSSSSASRDRLLRAVHEWSGDGPADDDQTLVAMRWPGPGST